MVEKRNLVFLSQHFNNEDNMSVIADAITKDSPELYVINRENGFPYKLNSSQLNDIKRIHPNTITLYTSKPIIQNGRTLSIGKWQSVGIGDILINKNELDKQKNEKITKVDITALEAKMSITSAWYKNDFAAILAAHNMQLDEQSFRDLIFFAVEFEGLMPLAQTFKGDSDPKERNYVFAANTLLDLAQRKKLHIGGLVLAEEVSEETPKIQFQTKPKRLSAVERKKRYQEEADRIQNKHPQATKSAIAQAIINHLLEHDPSYIKKEDGDTYPSTTIIRLIKLKKVSTV